MPRKDAHCSWCGHPYPDGLSWPRTCPNCRQITYRNPLPVAVVLVPVEQGLLAIRRGIEPRRGLVALPGGFINLGESWQEAGAREVFEETGLRLDPTEIRLFDARSAPDGTLLVFGLAQNRRQEELPPFSVTEETTECLILHTTENMAFDLHAQVAGEYLTRHPRGE